MQLSVEKFKDIAAAQQDSLVHIEEAMSKGRLSNRGQRHMQVIKSMKSIVDNNSDETIELFLKSFARAGAVYFKWILRVDLFIRMNGNNYGPIAAIDIVTDKMGKILEFSEKMYYDFKMFKKPALEPTIERTELLLSAITFGMFCLAFLNCQNVEPIIVKPHPTEARKHYRKHGNHLIKYKVLRVIPIKKIKEKTENKSILSKQLLPHHICRGHFKDYRDRGLFGKYKGIFWWDQFVRGEKNHGVIVKDYELTKNQQIS